MRHDQNVALARRFRPIRRAARRLTDVPFAALVGYLGVNNAVTFVAHPGQQAASLLAPPLDYAWIALYGTGGALILAGIATALANVEAAGCIVFGAGAAVSALATAVERPGAWNSAVALALFATAAGVRAWHLATGRVLVLLTAAEARQRRRGRGAA